ncbi:MAG: hypothetical protein C0473_00860 [Cyanobacteria bacterium DS3.002]|nr:hypothetical protein [Cyanobacteria bacterium DS3.002]MBA4049497.1 hypothetical protein [Cyanobacteria bacterium DS2.008]MBA4074395.1 hypothetical protein [Cyanobacteria bacterium PR.023]
MTVNVVYLTQYGSVHATDSLIVDGHMNLVPETSGKPKIVILPNYNGAASWFGFAGFMDQGIPWAANDWLEKEYEKHKEKTPTEFGEILVTQLNDLLGRNTGPMSPPRGMGIHLTFYETVQGKPVPELLWITNNNGITGLGGYKQGEGPAFVSQRQTFHNITKQENFENHGNPACRLVVDNYLSVIKPLPYQNGDNVLTNMPINIVEALVETFLVRRELVSTDNLRIFGKRALFRVEFAALAQKCFALANKIKVGSPCFNLMITPTGEYFTDTPYDGWHLPQK